MPVTWNAESKEKLFVTVMALHPITGLDCNAVATMFGDGVTASAIQNQMKRIRKEAIILAAARGSVSVSATVAPKGTPRAEPHPTKRGKHSTNKKRKAKDMADSASEGFEKEKVGSDGSDSIDEEHGKAMGTQMIKTEGSDGGNAGEQNLKVEHDEGSDGVV